MSPLLLTYPFASCRFVGENIFVRYDLDGNEMIYADASPEA